MFFFFLILWLIFFFISGFLEFWLYFERVDYGSGFLLVCFVYSVRIDLERLVFFLEEIFLFIIVYKVRS